MSLLRLLKSSILGSVGAVSRLPFCRNLLLNGTENYQLVRNPFPKLQRRKKYPFQVLNFHRVLPEPDPFTIDAITTREFSQYLEILTAHFRIISLEQLLDEWEDHALRPNTICITFDDGYKDNFDYAFPILRHYNVPATIFLTTEFIDTNEMLWHDIVLFAIKSANTIRINIEEAGVIDVELTSDQIRQNIAFKLLEWLKTFTPDERDIRINKLLEICQLPELPDLHLMLNWQEIRQMHRAGILFGAHTQTHPILSSLCESRIEEEIFGSKKTIENELGVTISAFAYPNGQPNDFDDRCKRLLKKAGFRCAVTSCRGVNTSDQDPFELYRGRPWDRDPHRFYSRLLITRFIG